MNYHNIQSTDMLNGTGLRVTAFFSGCSHHCNNCQNQQTWDSNSGIIFDDDAKQEIFAELDKDYINGITLSGGDPLNEYNVRSMYLFVKELKEKYQNKTIWLYTGYTLENILESLKLTQEDDYRLEIVKMCDVIVDGCFVEELADINYPYAGSTNQRVIDIKKTLEKNEVVLYCD